MKPTDFPALNISLAFPKFRVTREREVNKIQWAEGKVLKFKCKINIQFPFPGCFRSRLWNSHPNCSSE